jgi:hypothetical protein
MLASDFIRNSLYKGVNQKLPSSLLGDSAMINALNYALNDVLSYEGRNRSFTFHTKALGPSDDGKYILDYPIIKVLDIYDMKTDNPQLDFEPIQVEPVSDVVKIKRNEYFIKPNEKGIWLPPTDVGYVVCYTHRYDWLEMQSEIPLPNCFLGPLFNLSLTYLYPIQGQYGEGKEVNAYQKAREQLNDLSKNDRDVNTTFR